MFESMLARYTTAAGLLKARDAATSNSWVRERTDLRKWAAAFSLGTNGRAAEHELLLATNSNPREAAVAVLRDSADLDPVLDQLRTASRRPHARFNLHYEEDNPAAMLLPHLSRVKSFCQVLKLRASAEVASGHMDDALSDLQLLFYLADTTRNEPILISQLVRMEEFRMALQPLAEGMGQWSEAQLQTLQKRLQTFDFFEDVRHAFEAERTLFGNGIIEWVRRSPNKLRILDEFGRSSDSRGGTFPVAILMSVAPDGWLYLEERNYSRTCDQYVLPLLNVANHQIQPDLVRKSQDTITRLCENSSSVNFLQHNFFSALLLPSFARVIQKTGFTQTAADLSAIACALARYRLAHGQLPDSLDNLCPGFIEKLPRDIINGAPLRYRVLSDGRYLLYSIGWNEKDDGGQNQPSKKGEAEQAEGDWVWTDF
jgi:hypothetical protein